jgi:hypothetical protein
MSKQHQAAVPANPWEQTMTNTIDGIRKRVVAHREHGTPGAAAPRDRDRLMDAVDAVLALAETWRYKGEFGWGAWQEGHGPDHEGTVLDAAAAEIRSAIEKAVAE